MLYVNELKKASLIFVVILLVVTIVSAVLAFVPTRQRHIEVPKGFYYGEATSQVPTQTAATLTRKWYGFPASVAETEVIQYQSGSYESATYTIQKFSWFFALVNMVFWFGLTVAVLAPVTIFSRSQSRSATTDKQTIEETKSPKKSDAHTGD